MSEKPKLAFGYGFDPETLRDGVHLTNCFARPHIGENIILCEFEPHLSAINLHILGELMNYDISKVGYGEIKKENTKLKFSGYFVTDGEAKDVVDNINKGLEKLFKQFDPVPLDQ